MKIGQKFMDEYGQKLTLVEINDMKEYVVSYYDEDYGGFMVMAYEKDELEKMKNLNIEGNN